MQSWHQIQHLHGLCAKLYTLYDYESDTIAKMLATDAIATYIDAAGRCSMQISMMAYICVSGMCCQSTQSAYAKSYRRDSDWW